MATRAVRAARAHPLLVTGGLSVVGYLLVVGTFVGLIPREVYPELSIWWVNRLADGIAVVNTSALAALVVGWRRIRRGEVAGHRRAMLVAFGLIVLFLVLYLLKVGGGGTKEFVGPQAAHTMYLAMLAVHIVLSVVAVPLVVYQVVTGLSHTPAELRERVQHRRVGRLGAAAWIISLALGVTAYLLLNHVYGWRFVDAAA